jgi:hypothetical protein
MIHNHVRLCGVAAMSLAPLAFGQLCILALVLFLSVQRVAAAGFVPDFKLKPDDYTVLMAVDAKLSAGLAPSMVSGHGKFFVQGWQRPDQQAEWKVTVGEAADYAVQVLANRNGNQVLRLGVTAAGKTLTGTLPADARRWWLLSRMSTGMFTTSIRPPAGNLIRERSRPRRKRATRRRSR